MPDVSEGVSVGVAGTSRRRAAVRHVEVAQIMGLPISIHVIRATEGHENDDRDAAQRCFERLREIDRVFSPYRADSDVSRIQRGELAIPDADPRVAVVAEACAQAREQTGGLFSADYSGRFDPTGYVKGWAVEAAARAELEPLVTIEDVRAVGINAGGDMQLFTAPGSGWVWRVGVQDPERPDTVRAIVPIVEGAVATSGTTARGHHIIDPRTGVPSTGATSATVVAPTLTVADVWATAAFVAGFDDLRWLTSAPKGLSGVVLGSGGAARRFVGGVELVERSDMRSG